MSYQPSGELTTDSREIASSEEWSSQSDWEANQETSGVAIDNGTVRLEELGEIPDSEDLHGHWAVDSLSLNDGESITTVPDLSGNGHDLSGSATFQDDSVNGYPIAEHDGDNDTLSVDFSSLSQPNHIFFVGRIRTISGGSVQNIIHSTDGNGRHAIGQRNGDNWEMFAGSQLNGGSPDIQFHVFNALFDSGSSRLRIDGSQIMSGGPGSEGLNGHRWGANAGGSEFYTVDVGEVLIYPMDKSSVESDAEGYLGGKWGISV